MALINKQDTNGSKALLARGELGYDDYAAGGDVGRVYVGTGSINIPLAKKSEGAPLGSIIAIVSNLSGSYSIPSSGVVDSGGWMYCDGSAIPAGKAVSGTVPNLVDGRFIRGSTSAGGTGGADSFTLATANIPAHTHSTPDHSHSASSDNTGAHTHTYSWGRDQNQYNSGTIAGTGRTNIIQKASSSAGAHSHVITIDNGGASTTGSTGSTSAKSHIPKYVNVVYLIKVD